MTAHNTIPDGDIDPDSPLTTNLVTWLRDNPIAQTEGAVGAPKTAAIALSDHTNGAKITAYMPISQTYDVAAFTTYIKIFEFRVPRDGNVTTSFRMRNSVAGQTAFGRIYINGSAVGTERSTTSTSFTTYQEGVAVNTGDLVQLYVKETGSGTVNIIEYTLQEGEIFHVVPATITDP